MPTELSTALSTVISTALSPGLWEIHITWSHVRGRAPRPYRSVLSSSGSHACYESQLRSSGRCNRRHPSPQFDADNGRPCNDSLMVECRHQVHRRSRATCNDDARSSPREAELWRSFESQQSAWQRRRALSAVAAFGRSGPRTAGDQTRSSVSSWRPADETSAAITGSYQRWLCEPTAGSQ